MKLKLKKMASVLLSAAMLASTVYADPAPQSIGTNLRTYSTGLHDGLTYSANTVQHNSAGRVEERVFIREADSRAVPVVVGGDYIYNSNLTLKQASDKLSAAGYTVIGGVTGDMFSTSTGVALGMTVRNGILRTCDNGDLWAAGFKADGTAIVGAPALSTTLTAGDRTIKIDRVNRVRDVDKITLYTPDFSTDTRTTKQGRHVVLTVAGSLKIGGTVTGVVKEVKDGAAAEPLRQGEMVLSASSAAQVESLGTLTAGMEVSISVTSGYSGWDEVQFACGGLHALVKNGSAVTGLGNDRAPRTAVGMRADGSLVLFAVDGRQSGYSNGMSLTEVAQRMISLGCTNALELDGGGSTAAGLIEPGNTEFSVVNSPSDGSLRRCTNYIFLVNPTEKIDKGTKGFIYGTQNVILAGASAQMTFRGVDDNWHRVWVSQPVWDVADPDIGKIDDNGMFIGLSAGTSTINANWYGLLGSREITVTETVDTLRIYSEADGSEVKALQNGPGKTISLRAEAMLNSFKVVSEDTCFTWSVSGDAGKVDENGNFTYGEKVGSVGLLTVEGAGRTVTVPITVGVAPVVVEDFEGTPAVSAEGSGMTFRQDISIKAAGRGMKSGQFDYTFTPAEGQDTPEATIGANITLSGSPAYLNLLLRGDGSNHTLEILFTDAAGNIIRVGAGALSGNEYKALQLPVPAGSVKISGFALKPTGSKTSGSFHLDHLVAAWNERSDTSAPAITLIGPDTESQPGNLIFTADIKDSAGVSIARSGISVTWNGNSEEFLYDVYTGKLSITVPEPESDLHILTVTATDVFGNRRKASVQVKRDRSDNLDRFIDVKGKWMEMYADFIDDRGVLAGREEQGLRYFDPSKELTRLEMVEMAIKLMGVDVNLYSGTVLPFTDAGEIPQASLPAVKAAYALGVVAGIGNGNGSVSLGWNQSIMRQDFCVIMLGAVPKGYNRKALEFTDNSDISAYAVEAVETFVNLGAVSGMGDGTFKPKKTINRAEAAAALTNLFF